MTHKIQAIKGLLEPVYQLANKLNKVARDAKSLRHLSIINFSNEILGDHFDEIQILTDNAASYERAEFDKTCKSIAARIEKTIDKAQPIILETYCQTENISITNLKRDIDNGKEIDGTVRNMMEVYESYKWLNDLLQEKVEEEENSSYRKMIESRISNFVFDYYLVITLLERARGIGSNITKFEVIGARQVYLEHKKSWDKYEELRKA